MQFWVQIYFKLKINLLWNVESMNVVCNFIFKFVGSYRRIHKNILEIHLIIWLCPFGIPFTTFLSLILAESTLVSIYCSNIYMIFDIAKDFHGCALIFLFQNNLILFKYINSYIRLLKINKIRQHILLRWGSLFTRPSSLEAMIDIFKTDIYDFVLWNEN